MLPKAGELFRQFRVIDRVGAGGMGVVYRAHDTKLGRDVALKFLTHVGPTDTDFAYRLRREARALGALNHPNIVTIYDIADDEGVPFLVLEWIDGRALNEPSFPLPLAASEVLRIGRAVAGALAASHGRGIIHRDVKPGNVLVATDGRVKLVDFGLSTVRTAGDDATRTQGVLGTVAYMSPEQARGRELTPASDVFACGVLMYELLTGQRPFQGEGAGGVLAAILADERVPLADLREDLPEALVGVVERCLEPDPGMRFADGQALVRALQQVESGGGPDGPATPGRTGSGRPARQIREQEIRFTTTADGVRVAYSVVGSGPVLVRVLGHFTHLEMEWQWPDMRLFWERLAERHTVVRYDGRGIGLSDRFAGEFSEETRQLDLDAVLGAVAAKKAMLLGTSEGGWTAATHALQHPDRVSHLILYGAYCRGAQARPGYDAEEDRALMTLVRKGWGRDTPAFRQVFTSQFFRPDADPGLLSHFNEMQRASADPETAARYHESCHQRGDGRELFQQVRTPTLVVQCLDDRVVHQDEARLLASTIPGARLVLLPGGSHYFPTDRNIVTKVVGAINRFVHGADA